MTTCARRSKDQSNPLIANPSHREIHIKMVALQALKGLQCKKLPLNKAKIICQPKLIDDLIDVSN